MEDNIDFEKLEQHAQNIKVVIANDVCNNLTKEIEFDTTSSHLNEQSRNLLKKTFENTDNGESETFIKAILGAATVIAQEKGELQDVPNDAEAISTIIDDSYLHGKLSWLVSKGSIAAEDAIDELVDRAYIRVFAYIERILKSEFVREIIVDGFINITYFIPKIGVIVAPILESKKKYIHLLISNFDDDVIALIGKTLNKIACAAKQVVATIREKVERLIISKVEKVFVKS